MRDSTTFPAGTAGPAKLALATLAVAAAVALIVPAVSSGARRGANLQTKREVEIILLSARKQLGRFAPGLIDPRTRLLRTNTRATCRGLGAPVRATYHTFRCVVAHKRTRLLLRYTVIGQYGATLRRLSP